MWHAAGWLRTCTGTCFGCLEERPPVVLLPRLVNIAVYYRCVSV